MPRGWISAPAAERLRDVWSSATSLEDAMRKAGFKTHDRRNMQRYRRQAESLLDITLPAHNEKNHTNTTHCPSNLDIPKARKSEYFIVTSVTNDAPIAEPFFESLTVLSDKFNAQILAIPCNYQNQNALNKTEGNTWPEELRDYYLNKDLILNKNLIIKRTRIAPTTVNPLAGKQNIGGTRSAVYGHPQLALQSVATPADEYPKLITTTGSLSRPRYGDSPTGDKAIHHHSIGAKLIRVKGARFWMWDLIFDGKGFFHLDVYYTPSDAVGGHRAAGYIEGDAHVQHIDKNVFKARYGRSEASTARLLPLIIVRHDVHDHYSQSHHNTLFDKIRVAKEGNHLVKNELDLAVKYLNDSLPSDCENWIVSSNHHNHLKQWLERFRPERDPHNAPFYFELMKLVTESMDSGDDCDPFYLYVKDKLNHSAKWLSPNELALIAGNDVSQHGDKGANGARPSPRSFANANYKMVVGHSHQPWREKGSLGVGRSKDGRLGYEHGLSSHMVADAVIYPNGKITHLFYVKGSFGL